MEGKFYDHNLFFFFSPSMVANTKSDKIMKIELLDDVFTILDLENLLLIYF